MKQILLVDTADLFAATELLQTTPLSLWERDRGEGLGKSRKQGKPHSRLSALTLTLSGGRGDILQKPSGYFASCCDEAFCSSTVLA